MSIDADAAGLKLVNDSATPGINRYYGTDGAGVKGFHVVPGASQIIQNVFAQNTLTVAHNLNKYPTVLCLETPTNKQVIPAEVVYVDTNNVTIQWLSAFSGRVIVG